MTMSDYKYVSLKLIMYLLFFLSKCHFFLFKTYMLYQSNTLILFFSDS